MDRASHASADRQPLVSRRRALGLVGASLLAAFGGCSSTSSPPTDRGQQPPVSLSIRAPPADADPRATRVARTLAANLTAVGASATVVPVRRETLRRDVLVNQDFDVYVGRYPGLDEPDALRQLFHSSGVDRPGWRNPFGFSDRRVDALLDRQRRQTGDARTQTLATLQRELAERQPLSMLGFVDELRAHRTAVTHGATERSINSKLGYLSLSLTASDEETADAVSTPTQPGTPRTPSAGPAVPLRVALTDVRPLKNLNPLSVTSRVDGAITSLLYDSLGERIDGAVRPWLAESWTWVDRPDATVLDVDLRDGIEWHDGTPIDAADVAFTYRFVEDTSLGESESPVPAPRFTDRTALVAATEVLDPSTVRFRFQDVSRPVAMRALEIPLLPRHVWSAQTGQAFVGGLDSERAVTDALAWANRSPVGSGPFEFDSLTVQERLELVPFADHRPTATDTELRTRFDVAPPDRPLVFRRAPSGGAALALLQNEDADVTARGLSPDSIHRIRSDPTLELSVTPTTTFYHVGYNTRRAPLDDPAFRRCLAGLLDAEFFAETVCDGYVEPAATPLARDEALAPALAWDGRNPAVPFLGSDGDLDVDRARAKFESAGYQYREDGTMVVG